MRRLTAIAASATLVFVTWLGWTIYSQERLEAQCDDLAASFGAHLSNGRRSESAKYLIWCGNNGPSDTDVATIRDATAKIINAGLGQTEMSLDLSKTLLSDDAIPELAAIRGLYYIDVSDTAITANGADALRSRMPGTIIRWSPKQKPDGG